MYVRGHFRTHWFNWKLSKEHLYFVQISTFLEGVSPRILVKNDQILRSAKLTFVFFPRDLGVWYLSLGNHFFSANNALKKNFLFNSHPNFIFFGLFLCLWSLERPKKCLTGRLRTHWFDWKLLEEYLYFVQKSTFLEGVSPRFLVKNDQIWRSAKFTFLCP